MSRGSYISGRLVKCKLQHHLPKLRGKKLLNELVDSPEGDINEEELEGLISLPGSQSNFKISEIPVVTSYDQEPGVMLNFVKSMSPSPTEASSAKMLATYLKSSCTSPDNSSVENTCTSKDIDHFFTAIDSSAIMTENKHLKEMLVSQLDLIQQQSETILSRDKQMKELRIENEHLRQRLERMERRVRGESVSARRRKSDIEKSEKSSRPHVVRSSRTVTALLSSDSETRVRKRSGFSEGGEKEMKKIKLEVEQKEGEEDNFISRQLIFHSEYQGDNLTDEIIGDSDEKLGFADSFHTGNINAAAEKSQRLSIDCDRESVVSRCKSNSSKENAMEFGNNINLENNKETNTEKKSQPPKNDRMSKIKQRRQSVTTVTTTGVVEPLYTKYLYYVGCGNDIGNPDDQLTDVSSLQRGVEVPRWREDPSYEKYFLKNKSCKKGTGVNKRTSASSQKQEGLENVEESVFLKRHEKPEAAEKRTKKWDLQRLRQKSYNDKLRARYENSSRNKRHQPETLLPTPEEAEKIRMVDTSIPVSAFGESVPVFISTPFTLPWMDDASRTENSQKSGNLRKSRNQ